VGGWRWDPWRTRCRHLFGRLRNAPATGLLEQRRLCERRATKRTSGKRLARRSSRGDHFRKFGFWSLKFSGPASGVAGVRGGRSGGWDVTAAERRKRLARQFVQGASFSRSGKETQPAIPGHGNGPLSSSLPALAGLAVIPGCRTFHIRQVTSQEQSLKRESPVTQRDWVPTLECGISMSAVAQTGRQQLHDAADCSTLKLDVRRSPIAEQVAVACPSIDLVNGCVPLRRNDAPDSKRKSAARIRRTVLGAVQPAHVDQKRTFDRSGAKANARRLGCSNSEERAAIYLRLK
jgi:hypothetical protein